MSRKITLMAVILSFITLSAYYVRGEEVFKGSAIIPIPSATRELRTEKTQFGNSDLNTTIYASQLSFKKITDFYRRNLTKNGWQDLLSGRDLKGRISPLLSLKQLIFKRDEEILTVTYLPTSARAGETRFSISRSKMPSFKEETQETAAKTMATIDIPAYPNSQPVVFSFGPSANKPLGYTTSDSAEEVFNFYRDKMPLHWWTLEKETPISQEEINARDLEKNPQYKRLSSRTMEELKNLSLKTGYLAFKKKDKTCIIGIVEALGQDSGEDNTFISIVYGG
jgi:hypothetical protein